MRIHLLPALAVPLVQYHTTNGFTYWDVPLPEGCEETEALRIRRAFEVRRGKEEPACCVVEITTSVRESVRTETHREFPPGDPLWEMLCRNALNHYLWNEARLPPPVLPVYELTWEDQMLARRVAGVSGGSRW